MEFKEFLIEHTSNDTKDSDGEMDIDNSISKILLILTDNVQT